MTFSDDDGINSSDSCEISSGSGNIIEKAGGGGGWAAAAVDVIIEVRVTTGMRCCRGGAPINTSARGRRTLSVRSAPPPFRS